MDVIVTYIQHEKRYFPVICVQICGQIYETVYIYIYKERKMCKNKKRRIDILCINIALRKIHAQA